MSILKLLFGMEQKVSRLEYLLWGIVLMAIKYLGELGLYSISSGKILTPLNFLSPMLSIRYPEFNQLPDWFAPILIFWSLPFIWVGTSMSIRRSVDAGCIPLIGLLFFVPGVNYLMIFALCLAPTKPDSIWSIEKLSSHSRSVMMPVIISIALAAFGTLFAWYNSNFLRTYGASLFLGTPLLLGAFQGYLLGWKQRSSFIKTLSLALFTVVFTHLLLLIFALEGAICLAMSLPLCSVLSVMGASLGWSMAKYSRPNFTSPSLMVLALPLFPLVEAQVTRPYQDIVLSTIEISATPEKVWPNVVSFSNLPPTTDWLFQLGVAYPLRARIEGRGEGAVRYCEFSTGAFVEPITVWEKPTRLAFDVRYQPQPMKEFSFYDQVDAPHLDGYFRSVKGEFRLVPLGDGKTRLEGRTWYEMDIQPGWYWQIYGRWFIHKIHLRVLDHIKNLSEAHSG